MVCEWLITESDSLSENVVIVKVLQMALFFR